jgi:hypothetical protein
LDDEACDKRVSLRTGSPAGPHTPGSRPPPPPATGVLSGIAHQKMCSKHQKREIYSKNEPSKCVLEDLLREFCLALLAVPSCATVGQALRELAAADVLAAPAAGMHVYLYTMNKQS